MPQGHGRDGDLAPEGTQAGEVRRHEEACRRVDDVVVRMGGTRHRLVVWHSLVASGLVAGTEHMAHAGGPLNGDRRRIGQARSPAAGAAAVASGAWAWMRAYSRGPRSPAQRRRRAKGLDDLRGLVVVRGGAAGAGGGAAGRRRCGGAGGGATGTAAGGSSRRTALRSRRLRTKLIWVAISSTSSNDRAAKPVASIR